MRPDVSDTRPIVLNGRTRAGAEVVDEFADLCGYEPTDQKIRTGLTVLPEDMSRTADEMSSNA